MDQNNNIILPNPNSDQSKKVQVAGMFDNIAKKYDFLNHFLSVGIDRGWRKKAIKSISIIHPKKILDVATGTGDLAISALTVNPDVVIGVDISEGMLEVGRNKINEKKLDSKIKLQYGDSENLPFENDAFDAITCAYGTRNFEHLSLGLSEMARVMKPGGRLAILEFSKPKKFPFKQVYNFYFRRILPGVGKIVSKDATAYTYLPESVMAFPEGSEFCNLMKKAGFSHVQARPLTMGITTLYTATK